jgi:divalent metal cation (Fe/Co/Zn/Cd) transporter
MNDKTSLILSILLRLAAAVLLVAALARHPYGYYQILRLVVCAVSIYSAYLAAQFSRQGWLWFFGGVAVLFNPLLPVHLNREAWAGIDLGVAIGFLASVWFLRKAAP